MFFKYSKNQSSVLEWFWWYKAPLSSKRPRINLLDHLKQLHVEFTLESKVIKINQDASKAGDKKSYFWSYSTCFETLERVNPFFSFSNYENSIIFEKLC